MNELSIFWQVTNACNLKCITCLTSSGRRDNEELGLKESSKLVTQLSSSFDIKKFFLTGGEPLMAPGITDFITALSQAGISIEIVTNGTIKEKKILDSLKDTKTTVNVSFDSHERTIHDQIRGDGSFYESLSFVRECVARGIRVQLSYTVNKKNFHGLKQVGKFAKDLGCYQILVSEIVERGRAENNWPELALDDCEKENLVNVVKGIAEEFSEGNYLGEDSSCWVDGSSVFVDPKGKIFHCSEIGQVLPNAHITKFGDENFVQKLKEAILSINRRKFGCCYSVVSFGKITLIKSAPQSCSFISHLKKQKGP